MKTLTNAQAEMLRRYRPRLRPAAALLSDFGRELASACDCDHDPDNCPTCDLYSLLADAELKFTRFAEELDAKLLRGPEPTPPEVAGAIERGIDQARADQ